VGESALHEVRQVVLDLFVGEKAQVVLRFLEVLLGKFDYLGVLEGNALLLNGDLQEELSDVW